MPYTAEQRLLFPVYFAFLLNLSFAGHLIFLRVICKLIFNDYFDKKSKKEQLMTIR